MERAEKFYLENPELKEERAMLVETWRDMEETYGNEEEKEIVNKKLPKKIKKRRKIKILEGEDEDLGSFIVINYQDSRSTMTTYSQKRVFIRKILNYYRKQHMLGNSIRVDRTRNNSEIIINR